eukprot:5928997-Amphidinium_carterae.1
MSCTFCYAGNPISGTGNKCTDYDQLLCLARGLRVVPGQPPELLKVVNNDLSPVQLSVYRAAENRKHFESAVTRRIMKVGFNRLWRPGRLESAESPPDVCTQRKEIPKSVLVSAQPFRFFVSADRAMTPLGKSARKHCVHSTVVQPGEEEEVPLQPNSYGSLFEACTYDMALSGKKA